MKLFLAAFATFGMFAGAGPWLVSRPTPAPDVNGAASDPDSHDVQVTPWGPSPEVVEAARARLSERAALQPLLAGARHRVLSFEILDDEKAGDGIVPPHSYRATVFDYTRNRAFVVRGRFDGDDVVVRRSAVQPEPSEEEFQAAVAALDADVELGPALRAGLLAAYPPMPPLIDGSLPVDRVRRTVAVGLAPAKGAAGRHEIVGVDMIRGRVVRFKEGAPPSALAAVAACGPPNAAQSTTSRGTAGQFNIVITRGGVELWNMIAIRPSASGGTRGSGVELRNVSYRGKRVLARAMVPILNVQYEGNLCGPFRDWQWQEGSFAASGTNVAPGVRRATAPPQTILENGTDTGNFRGLAFHDDGSSVQLVSELQAGWYRYITKWVFRDDGVIQPRFGFGGVNNTCICNLHHHHAYWRFNFDVVQAARNSVCLAETPETCTPLTAEARLAAIGAHLEVRNDLGTEAYRLVPGPGDGVPNAYSKATAWVLAYQDGQVDDGVNCTQGSSCQTSINIDRFVNGQSVAGRDVVVWYRGSFNHDEAGEHPADHEAHIVGPELRPGGW